MPLGTDPRGVRLSHGARQDAGVHLPGPHARLRRRIGSRRARCDDRGGRDGRELDPDTGIAPDHDHVDHGPQRDDLTPAGHCRGRLPERSRVAGGLQRSHPFARTGDASAPGRPRARSRHRGTGGLFFRWHHDDVDEHHHVDHHHHGHDVEHHDHGALRALDGAPTVQGAGGVPPVDTVDVLV
jgi:hypothetical protein